MNKTSYIYLYLCYIYIFIFMLYIFIFMLSIFFVFEWVTLSLTLFNCFIIGFTTNFCWIFTTIFYWFYCTNHDWNFLTLIIAILFLLNICHVIMMYIYNWKTCGWRIKSMWIKWVDKISSCMFGVRNEITIKCNFISTIFS